MTLRGRGLPSKRTLQTYGLKELFPPSSLHSYVAIDTETTGLSPTFDRIIQLGLVLLDGDLTSIWEGVILFDPAMHIPSEASAIHGLSDLDVDGANSFADAAVLVDSLLDSVAVLGHNVAFDLSFLRGEFARLGRGLPKVSASYCTLELSRRYLPKMRSYTLSACLGAVGATISRPHDAGCDAEAAASLFRILAQLARDRGEEMCRKYPSLG